jgi:site-specific DNA-adenine methylase
MKNHFIFSYSGNKRNEVEYIYNTTKDIYKYEDIKTIVEPFCGSCAYSYYISTLYPKKYKYILNDNDKFLYGIFLLIVNETSQTINDNMNVLINEFNKYDNDKERKEFYISLCNDKNNLYKFFFISKYYNIRRGLYPLLSRINQIKPFKIEEIPFYKFVKTEDIEFLNCDSVDIIKKYKDDTQSILFLDPPYVLSCNSAYNCPEVNCYEYLQDNNINLWMSSVICCFENTWIIKLLFRENKISIPYDKQYQMTKKNTTHIIITK